MAVLTATNESHLVDTDTDTNENDTMDIVDKVVKIYKWNDADFTAEIDLGIDVYEDDLLAEV